MNVKIWIALSQILYDRNDLANIIKPFFENLNNENINDHKIIPVLKNKFSKFQLDVLFRNGIITEENFYSLIEKNKKENQFQFLSSNLPNNNELIIEDIISGDKINELDKILQEKDIKTFNTITKSFLPSRSR